MQKPCQDSYYTLFSSYPMLLDYHEEQAKNSRWIRCKVADLQVEPLSESSPLIGNLSAFAAGTSQEAVKDTAENLGLAMRVNGELYPVRVTAYKSLLDRAKIGGTALPKLSREVLAEVLNECLKLYSADALLLIRDEKISAVHSGDDVDYSVLPIDELLKVLQAKLDARFSGNEFESGYCDQAMGFHFQLVDAYVRFTLNERKFGPKTDAEGQKKRETALQSFTQVAQDGRKRFSSFSASTQEQYKTCINNYIKTILPVWMQYRNTYINF